jgi:ribose 1,5-bisphosphate isomerase
MDSPAQVAEKIRSVKIQGAKEIAIYSLEYLRKFCKKYGFGLKFGVAVMVLENARPTADVLHNCLEILKKKKNLRTIDHLIKRLNEATRKIAKNGEKIIPNGARIMTHCHSSEALAVIKEAWKDKKRISVIATVTEPLHQGIKTAKELARLKIPVTLIDDNAAGHLMKDVNLVIVGCDALRKNGVVNKVGTSLLALAARKNRKPFYVAGNTLKLDRRQKLVIEERPASEICKKIKGIKVRNPAFDLTDWEYVTAVITEKGVLKPDKIKRMLR